MEDIAFLELARGSIENMAAGDSRVNGKQGQDILELITEAEGAAGLIEACTAPYTAGKCLIEQPAIQDQVSSRIGGGNLYGAEQVVPEYTGTFVGSTDIGGIMVFSGQSKGLFFIAALT